MPRVSVVIATYNMSQLLPYSVGSVLRQTMSDLEVIVVGDGCTDDSAEVVASLGDQDSRVRWHNLPQNSGNQGAPNNKGIDLAESPFVAYMGHDDLMMPRSLELLLARQEETGADFVHGMSAAVRTDNSIVPARMPWNDYKPRPPMTPASVLHKRNIVPDNGGWRDWRELTCAPDADLWERLYHAGCKMKFLPRVVVLKFEAADRKDVYKLKSAEEQKRREPELADPDFESRVMAEMLIHQAKQLHRQFSIREHFKLVRRNLGHRVANMGGGKTAPRKGNWVAKKRKFKGLDQ